MQSLTTTTKIKPKETVFELYDISLKKNIKFTFKDYMKSKNIFTFRCASRNECSYQIRLSVDENFTIDCSEGNVTYYKFKDKGSINWTAQDKKKQHTCLSEMEENKNETEIRLFKKDKEFLSEFVRKNPLQSASNIKLTLEQQNYRFTKEEIQAELRRVRAEYYPKDAFLVFTPEYCKSLDDHSQNLFLCYLKTPIPTEYKNYSEIVILSTQFQLARLAESSDWYVDGTFWSCPPGFYQMINIMIFSQEINQALCVAHLLISSKKTEEYITAFVNLLVAANNAKILLSPKFIMADFEKGLVNALKWVFPKSKILGCQFHFAKALWKRAGKLGLRQKERKRKAAILINFILILVHIPKEDRLQYFEDLKSTYKNEDKPFQDLFAYFEKNWIDLDFVNLGEDRERITRTNNYCENFHSYLSKNELNLF